jgi:hypothetical protein
MPVDPTTTAALGVEPSYSASQNLTVGGGPHQATTGSLGRRRKFSVQLPQHFSSLSRLSHNLTVP